MKCPKCGYLGFERVDRCRNCGYDFLLTSPPENTDVFELPLKADPTRRFLDDLALLDAAMTSEPVRVSRSPVAGVESVPATAPEPASPTAPAHEELPLFGPVFPDDTPLITRPSPPRPPLAVRRSTPDVPRLRTRQERAVMLELDLEPKVRTAAPGAFPAKAPQEAEAVSVTGGEDATVGARFIAAVTDLLILAAIDVAVVYLTMQICGVGLDEIGILPRAPFVAFLLVQNGGYLVAFTAGGQTLGKVAVGIRVVSAEPRAPLDLGRAFVRELMWLILAAPAGLGLLTVIRHDRRGVHDRFAGTRVVRESL